MTITIKNKQDRRDEKLLSAQNKRQQLGTNGYRPLNVLSNTVSPILGRPWRTT